MFEISVEILFQEEVECLILDVRDRDAFTICHLKNGI